MAARDRDGIRVGRRRPLHHRLCLRGHLVYRSGSPDPGPAIQAGRVQDNRCRLPRWHLQLLMDLVQAWMHQRGLPMLANSGEIYSTA